MTFIKLIQRELNWWLKSPALWWSLPPIWLIISLQPQLLMASSKMKPKDLEGYWDFLVVSYNQLIKPKLNEYPTSLFLIPYKNIIQDFEALIALKIEQLWEIYILIPFQTWSFFPIIIIIPPLAVTLFKRDIENGFFESLMINQGSSYKFLIAKIAGNFIPIMGLQVITYFIYLYTLGVLTERSNFFQPLDPVWLICFFGLGCSLGLLTIVFCWWMCLFSRNLATEIYNSMLASLILSFIILILIMRFNTWGFYTFVSISLICYALIPILLIPLNIRMRQENFFLK